MTTTRDPATAGEFSIVGLPDEIDLTNASDVLAEMLSTINRGGAHLVVDASDVTFMDSSGLNALIRAQVRTEARGGSLHVVAPTHRMRRLFEISRLDRILGRVDSLDEAVRCLTGPSGQHTCAGRER